MVDVDNTIYIPNSGLTTQTALLGESVFKLGVYKAGINKNDTHVSVNLGVDQDAFTAFLATNPGYELLPAANYNIPSADVTITEEREELNIILTNINENTFAGKKYVLPISIKSISPSIKLNETKKTAFLYFTRYRNVYESKYKAYGKLTSDVGAITKIDEVQTSTSVSPNTLEFAGPVTGMKLRLAVLDNKVLVSGAPGSEVYAIQNSPAIGESTYSGQFDPVHQVNRGKFSLFYNYVVGGKIQQVAVDLTFTF
ncbi:hypothetical protein D3C86_1538790 [compost metagenome]